MEVCVPGKPDNLKDGLAQIEPVEFQHLVAKDKRILRAIQVPCCSRVP